MMRSGHEIEHNLSEFLVNERVKIKEAGDMDAFFIILISISISQNYLKNHDLFQELNIKTI